MATTPKSLLFLTIITVFTLSLTVGLNLVGSDLLFDSLPSLPTTTANNEETVYELLPKYGLPSGLLPNTVTNYSLSSDGQFVVDLEKPCYVQFDYLVYYDSTVTGKLSYGSITNLKGIEVQRFFLWLNVDEIRVDLPPSDNIYFQVGLINKKLDVDQFKTVHSCRDSVTGSPCVESSSKGVTKLPAPVDEIPMLLTE